MADSREVVRTGDIVLYNTSPCVFMICLSPRIADEMSFKYPKYLNSGIMAVGPVISYSGGKIFWRAA